MTIISVEKLENNCHQIQYQPSRSAVWIPGYISVPAHLEGAVWDSRGYCDLTIQDGVLTGITPKDPPPLPEPEPTDTEVLNALLGVM